MCSTKPRSPIVLRPCRASESREITGCATSIFRKCSMPAEPMSCRSVRASSFLSSSPGVVQALLGGWSTNWILTVQNGQPSRVPCIITTTSGFGCNALLVPGQNVYDTQAVYGTSNGVNHWLNPNAFASPPVATTIGQIRLHSARRRPHAIPGTRFPAP